MHIATVFKYLVGRRQAILEVASDRRALYVAALFVISAGLARNYDQASLVDEPWRLLGPFAASLAISGPLFLGVYAFARCGAMESPGIGRAYLSFLSLYWMTAPMAWLYGIPYEAFLSQRDAVRANLWTLGLVSAWRVALMIRVVSVLFNLRVRAALALVMLVADTAALTALHLVPLPVIRVMGGINPTNQLIAITGFLATAAGWLTLPIWVLLTGITAYSYRNAPRWQVASPPEHAGRSRGALVLAWLAVALWLTLSSIISSSAIVSAEIEERRAAETG